MVLNYGRSTAVFSLRVNTKAGSQTGDTTLVLMNKLEEREATITGRTDVHDFIEQF